MGANGPSRAARRSVAEPGSPGLYEAEAERMLGAAGLGRTEAVLYALLLRRPGGTADELAAQLNMPVRRARAILGVLANHGLLSRIARRPERYLAEPPDAAIEPLLTRRQQDLQSARELAAELAEHVRRAAVPLGGGQETIELLEGRDAVAQRVQQLEQAASTEILSFDRPPYHSTDNPSEVAGLARGVGYRAVYAREALDYPGRIDHIRAMTKQGEQARVFSPLPLKLFIFDRRMAILPVRPLDPELAAGCVLVRTSALLDALHMFFELVWERATPIALDASQPIGADQQADPAADGLVPLLAAGLTDEAAAHQLGISHRTLQRRIQALMKGLDAQSRFQAGYLIGLTLNPPRG